MIRTDWFQGRDEALYSNITFIIGPGWKYDQQYDGSLWVGWAYQLMTYEIVWENEPGPAFGEWPNQWKWTDVVYGGYEP